MATPMVYFPFNVVPIILTLTILAYTWLMLLLVLLLFCVLVKGTFPRSVKLLAQNIQAHLKKLNLNPLTNIYIYMLLLSRVSL